MASGSREPAWERVKEIVADALERPEEGREDFLDRLDEPASILVRARELVRAAARASGSPEGAPRLPEPPPRPGGRIGRYRLRRFVARGGMGEVYEAEQDRTGRRVALKLLGLGTARDRARFELEGRILGRLEHPAIAQVIEAGVHVGEDGREWPFFALEYVDGEPLDAWAARAPRGERLRLLVQVCRGVQHAHQKGVIHRDLKAANVLVVPPGAPKILDFGVARAVGDGEDSPRLTRAGQLVGTLATMSPEQLAGDPDAVDTRADVYALGVLLFECLTGRAPHELEGLPLPEAVQRLREEEPLTPAALDRSLRGDLDTICRKAMERDRERRYGSAAELADDLERHLRCEPIAARPASRVYQLRKFARRNRALVVTAAALAVLLAAGVAGTLYGLLQARAEAHNLSQVNAFLRELLAAAEPGRLGSDATLRQLLDSSAPGIDARFDDPRVRAELHLTVGRTYRGLGEYGRAGGHLAAALALVRGGQGDSSPESLALEEELQSVSLELEDPTEAVLERARELRARAARFLGEGHAVSLRAALDLAFVHRERAEYDAAERVYRDARERAGRALGEADEVTLAAANDLSVLLQEMGRSGEALELMRRVHAGRVAAGGPDDPAALRAHLNLASAVSEAGEHAEALALFDEALPAAERIWDDRHPALLTGRANRCSTLNRLGRFEEAAGEGRAVVALREEVLGAAHPRTLSARHNLCVSLAFAGRHEEAARETRRLLELAPLCDGCEENFVMRGSSLLSSLLADLGRPEEAEELSATSLHEHRRTLGPNHASTLMQASNHARLLQDLGRLDEAVPLLRETVDAWVTHHAEWLGIERTLRWNLGRALHEAGELEAAEAELLRAGELASEPGPAFDLQEWRERLAQVYREQGRDREAETVLVAD